VKVPALATIFPTVILGVPDKPVAVPVREPTKLVAVMIPTFKFVGGEILVVNPARLEALDILLLFRYLY
jgi:hypothetical protein